MTGVIATIPRVQFSNALGIPLAGGKLLTYLAGTTTPEPTFQDQDLTIANPTTITLDATGSCTLWLDPTKTYKFLLRNLLGVTQPGWPVDNISGAATSLSLIPTLGLYAKLSALAADVGSSLIGFVQSGMDAIKRTIQDKLREWVSPEDFGAKGDGVADDAPALQKAINKFTDAASCAVRLTPGKTYLLKSTVTTNNRSVVIDGNNAILLVGADMSYGLDVGGINCELRNFQINKAPGATVTAALRVTGLQHVIRNITSRAQTWPLFLHCQDMKESHIENLRVDNDVTANTGIVAQFDYCVNNTVSNSMVGFCAQAFYGSGLGHPTSGYHNEGILFTNLITVYAGKAINFDNGTFIAVSNSCLDFCKNMGVFVSNGTDLTVTGTWIASDTTNGFIGVGTTAAVSGVTVQACTLVRGAAAITGTAGFSLPGTDVLVIGNRLKFGMNGGVVTHPTSQVIGNSVSGTAIFSDESAVSVRGALAVSKVAQIDGAVTIGGALTVGGNKGIFPTALAGFATAGANGAPPAQVAAYASVLVGGTAYKLPLYN